MPTLLRAPRATLAALLLLAISCEPEKPKPPVPCGGEGERCVEPGHSTAAQCTEAGVCLATDQPCETHTDCYVLIEPGDEIPTWNRPQGGLGTHLNLRLEGLEEDKVQALLTLITDNYQLSDPNDPESKVTCNPISCRDDVGCECDGDAGFSCIEFPSGENLCAELICNQVNRQFRLDAHPYGAFVIPEMPIRFVNELGLEELDDRDVELTMGVFYGENEDDAEMVHTTVPVMLQVGDFVPPSWWNQ